MSPPVIGLGTHTTRAIQITITPPDLMPHVWTIPALRPPAMIGPPHLPPRDTDGCEMRCLSKIERSCTQYVIGDKPKLKPMGHKLGTAGELRMIFMVSNTKNWCP